MIEQLHHWRIAALAFMASLVADFSTCHTMKHSVLATMVA